MFCLGYLTKLTLKQLPSGFKNKQLADKDKNKESTLLFLEVKLPTSTLSLFTQLALFQQDIVYCVSLSFHTLTCTNFPSFILNWVFCVC